MIATSVLSLTVAVLLASPSKVAGNDQSRNVRIINEAGFKVDIYWINRWKNDELVKNSEEGVFHGAETQINSYISHEFEIQEIPNSKTGKCKEEECKKGHFQVNANDEQLIVLEENLSKITLTDNVSKAKEQAANVLRECKTRALEELEKDGHSSSEDIMNALMSCIDTSVEEAVEEKQNEIDFQQTLRFRLGSNLNTYACLDDHMAMSESIENKTWTGDNNIPRKVQIMFERGATKIHYIHNFLGEGECEALEKQIEYKQVDGTDGGLYAQQGSTNINWNDAHGVITKLVKKIHKYSTYQSHLGYKTDDTEMLFMQKFEGNPENPPRHEPHCEGTCDGSEWKNGDRVATMIAFCEVATKGNATHFANAGIHIYPDPRSAILINYADPKKGKTDDGFTKISVCGAMEGNNKIIKHSLRFSN